MKSNFLNKVHLEGLLYEHNLTKKVSGPNTKNPGTEFISGTISIATDDDCVNIVPIHFTYVVAVTKKGTANSTFTNLSNILNGAWKTVVGSGAENANKVAVDTTIDLNEFYSDRTGKEELVSVKRNEGGFIHPIQAYSNDRNSFRADMIITNVIEQEADEEKGLPYRATIKGTIFQNFTKALLPTSFTLVNEAGIKFFLDNDVNPKNPVFIEVRGDQISETIVKKIEEESSFGDNYVREVTSSRKDYQVKSCGLLQEWDSKATILASELASKMTERETYLATLKQRQEDYKASKNSDSVASNNDGFQF